MSNSQPEHGSGGGRAVRASATRLGLIVAWLKCQVCLRFEVAVWKALFVKVAPREVQLGIRVVAGRSAA